MAGPEHKIGAHLNLQGNELRSALIEPLLDPPINPSVGRIYFDLSLGIERVWDGTRWTPNIRLMVTRYNGEGVTLLAGTPVYVNAANEARIANTTSTGRKVVGLVYADIAAASNGDIQTDGIITLPAPTWDIQTGGLGGLVPDAFYYLNESGGLTTNPDVSTPGRWICPIGVSVSPTQLNLRFNSQTLI